MGKPYGNQLNKCYDSESVRTLIAYYYNLKWWNPVKWFFPKKLALLINYRGSDSFDEVEKTNSYYLAIYQTFFSIGKFFRWFSSGFSLFARRPMTQAIESVYSHHLMSKELERPVFLAIARHQHPTLTADRIISFLNSDLFNTPMLRQFFQDIKSLGYGDADFILTLLQIQVAGFLTEEVAQKIVNIQKQKKQRRLFPDATVDIIDGLYGVNLLSYDNFKMIFGNSANIRLVKISTDPTTLSFTQINDKFKHQNGFIYYNNNLFYVDQTCSTVKEVNSAELSQETKNQLKKFWLSNPYYSSHIFFNTRYRNATNLDLEIISAIINVPVQQLKQEGVYIREVIGTRDPAHTKRSNGEHLCANQKQWVVDFTRTGIICWNQRNESTEFNDDDSLFAGALQYLKYFLFSQIENDSYKFVEISEEINRDIDSDLVATIIPKPDIFSRTEENEITFALSLVGNRHTTSLYPQLTQVNPMAIIKHENRGSLVSALIQMIVWINASERFPRYSEPPKIDFEKIILILLKTQDPEASVTPLLHLYNLYVFTTANLDNCIIHSKLLFGNPVLNYLWNHATTLVDSPFLTDIIAICQRSTSEKDTLFEIIKLLIPRVKINDSVALTELASMTEDQRVSELLLNIPEYLVQQNATDRLSKPGTPSFAGQKQHGKQKACFFVTEAPQLSGLTGSVAKEPIMGCDNHWNEKLL